MFQLPPGRRNTQKTGRFPVTSCGGQESSVITLILGSKEVHRIMRWLVKTRSVHAPQHMTDAENQPRTGFCTNICSKAFERLPVVLKCDFIASIEAEAGYSVPMPVAGRLH